MAASNEAQPSPAEPSLAPRRATLAGARLAVIRNRKRGSEPFAEAIAAALRDDHGAEARVWVKSSPYSPLTRTARGEILGWADGAVAAPGDCGHGSSVLRHDIFTLEVAGCPVAWVDTPGRMPRVTGRGRTFEIEYAATRYLAADVERAGGIDSPGGRAVAVETFEKFGLHRALRLAGRARATPSGPGPGGTLWDYPPRRLAGWDGVADYPYVEIPALRGQDLDDLRRQARETVPALATLLTTPRT
jgi:hypothetical protein